MATLLTQGGAQIDAQERIASAVETIAVNHSNGEGIIAQVLLDQGSLLERLTTLLERVEGRLSNGKEQGIVPL